MSLRQHRDYLQYMANSEHRETCGRRGSGDPCGSTEPHSMHKWLDRLQSRWCPGYCPGCLSAAERELWARLADEVDAYLSDDGQEHASPWKEPKKQRFVGFVAEDLPPYLSDDNGQEPLL